MKDRIIRALLLAIAGLVFLLWCAIDSMGQCSAPTDTIRFAFESMATPPSVFDENVVTGERTLRKQQAERQQADYENQQRLYELQKAE